MMTKARLRIPAPHPKQRLIEACTAKRIIVNAGRRGGKTFLVARRACRSLSAGRRVLYTAPIAEQTDAFWERTTTWLAPAVEAGLVKKNETKRTLILPSSGGRIHCRTAFKPDHMRGGWGDDIMLDEFAYQDPEVWYKVCLPMLLDNNGDAMLISTPDRRNHFYQLYLTAKADLARRGDKARWAVFEFTSLDNPFLSAQALNDLTEDMTEEDYQQEILAQFLVGEGQVFTVDADNFWTPDRKAHESCSKIMTIDWGMKTDATSISIGCTAHQKELALIRFRKQRYPDQLKEIKHIVKDWKLSDIYAESNSMGLPNIQQLQDDGVPVQPFDTTAQSKRQIIQGLKLALERHEWQFVDDETGRLELEAYERTISKSTGQPSYGAPEGMHDDTVISRSIMVWGASHVAFPFSVANLEGD